jgi:minor extracellular serine protease Vpr
VAAWVHRGNWTDWTGGFRSYSQFVGGIATFSSVGPRIDGAQKPNLAAPGTAMISIKSSIFASGSSLTIDNDGVGLDGSGPANYYVMQGTSMATPHAAAVAALCRQAAPDATTQQIREAMENTASRHGIPDTSAGYGLINAKAAVIDLATMGVEGWMLIQ